MSNEFGLEMSKQSIDETIVEDFFSYSLLFWTFCWFPYLRVVNWTCFNLCSERLSCAHVSVRWYVFPRSTRCGVRFCVRKVAWRIDMSCSEILSEHGNEIDGATATYTWKLMFNFDLFHQKFSFSFFCCFSKGRSTLVRHWLSWAKMLDKFEFALWRPLSACVKLFKIISDSSSVQLSLRVSYLHVSTERHWIC